MKRRKDRLERLAERRARKQKRLATAQRLADALRAARFGPAMAWRLA